MDIDYQLMFQPFLFFESVFFETFLNYEKEVAKVFTQAYQKREGSYPPADF